MLCHLRIQYIPRNIHTALSLLCFVVVMYWLIYTYPSGLLHWHWGNLTIAPVPAKQPWWIWVNASCEFIMDDYITTTKQSTTKPCARFLGYNIPTRYSLVFSMHFSWKVNHVDTFSIGTTCQFFCVVKPNRTKIQSGSVGNVFSNAKYPGNARSNKLFNLAHGDMNVASKSRSCPIIKF